MAVREEKGGGRKEREEERGGGRKKREEGGSKGVLIDMGLCRETYRETQQQFWKEAQGVNEEEEEVREKEGVYAQ